jgi:hypothetical protein
MKDVPASYLRKHAVHAGWPMRCPDTAGVGCVVAVPALAESGRLFDTLADLCAAAAHAPEPTLALVVVNNRGPEHAPEPLRRDNAETLARLLPLMESPAFRGGLRLGVVDAASPGRELPPRDGVGLARKIGLDHGLAVLRGNGRMGGGLVCLDADTRVPENYLAALHAFFAAPGRWGLVLDFEHPLPPEEPLRSAALDYTLHLAVHALGLVHARSPYAFPTMGSAMGCTAAASAAAGGMRRTRAGEDFYFLQALAKTGPVEYLHETTVRPAARASDRVPFGTGRSLLCPDAGAGELRVYHPGVYRVLRAWLAQAGRDESGAVLLDAAGRVSPALCAYLAAAGFEAAWDGIRAQCKTPARRFAQFHRWFDAFRTLKGIHHLRDNGLPAVPVSQAAAEVLADLGVRGETSDREALLALARSTLRAHTAGRVFGLP